MTNKPLQELTTAELASAIGAGVPGAMTEESLRFWCRERRIARASLEASKKVAPLRAGRDSPRGTVTEPA